MSKPQLKQTLRGLPCPTSSLQRKKSLGPAFSTSRQESLCAYKQNTSEIANIWGRASKLFVQDFEKVHDFLGGDFKHVERGMISYQHNQKTGCLPSESSASNATDLRFCTSVEGFSGKHVRPGGELIVFLARFDALK